jgi:hypothetical protein
MIDSVNHASIRSLGANERRVRFPPLRPTLQGSLGLTKRTAPRSLGLEEQIRHRSKDGTRQCERRWLRFKSSRWYFAAHQRRRSQSVLGTAAAHSRVRDGSIPSTATKFSRVARAVFPPHSPREPSPAIYIARAGARPRLQIGCGRVQILGGVRIVRFAPREQSGPPCGNRAVG